MRIIAHAFSAYKWVILNSESFNKVYGKNKKTFMETIFFCAFLKFCKFLSIPGDFQKMSFCCRFSEYCCKNEKGNCII